MPEVRINSFRRPEKDGAPYEIVFSNGDILDFTGDEVMEYGLYQEEKIYSDYDAMCTTILAKRMTAESASYVLFSARTENQVRKRIEGKYSRMEENGWRKFKEAAIEKALVRLNELGYINDDEYCKRYIASAMRGKPISSAALLNDLVYKKGISKEIAESRVREAYENSSGFTDQEKAYRVLMKKTGGVFPADQKEIAKLYRFMAGKGFSYECTENAILRMKESGEEMQ